MNCKYKSDMKWVSYLLNNEYHIRKRLELYMLTDFKTLSNLEVNSAKTGKGHENSIIEKISNKNYEFRRRCLECLEEYYKESSLLEQEIWNLKFKQKYNSERVGYEVNYSKSTVNNYLGKIKKELLKRIIDIEKEVFEIED